MLFRILTGVNMQKTHFLEIASLDFSSFAYYDRRDWYLTSSGGCSRCGLVRFGLFAYFRCVFKRGFIYSCQKNVLNFEPKRGFFVQNRKPHRNCRKTATRKRWETANRTRNRILRGPKPQTALETAFKRCRNRNPQSTAPPPQNIVYYFQISGILILLFRPTDPIFSSTCPVN